MRLVAVQFEPGADKSANILQAGRLIRQAAAPGDLVSLPEMWTCLGADRATKLAQSEPLPPRGHERSDDEQAGLETAGEAYLFLSGTAHALGITLHGGSIGERVGDTLFNTTLVFGPDGRELARYRKIHLFDAVTPTGQGYRESSLFGAGQDVVTCLAPCSGGTAMLGLSICYDLRFPELFAALRRQGAEIILVPAAFTVETGRAHWEVLLRARAIETQCWIVAAATTGMHRDAADRIRHTFGHSLICDPWGEVRACLPEGAGCIATAFDPAILPRLRAAMPVLAHRRLP